MDVEIDPASGFCFGVVNAIRKAEEHLASGEGISCLGDIVHNSAEVERLHQKGLRIISHADLPKVHKGSKVLLRAHGEPPSTYAEARERNITLVDATCPVVLRLQKRVKECYDSSLLIKDPALRPQIVIYGQRGHAEVNGLVGQTGGNAIVIENPEEITTLDFNRPIALYAQTTKPLEGFREVIELIRGAMAPGVQFESFDTICRQVANRATQIQQFAKRHPLVLFVAGRQSSNGKVLYRHCLQANPNTRLVPTPEELMPEWLEGATSVGICGATSTPRWLMEAVRERVFQIIGQ